MHKKFCLHILTFAALGLCPSSADTITLKSGKVYEGKVLSETETEYNLEVFVTRTIKDRKTVKKSDVESIEVEAPDLKPYEALKDTLPTPDQLPASSYKALIDQTIAPFIRDFPKSEHIDEVKKILSTLEEELKRVEAGDVRIDGNWIAASEWDANAYELDAQLELSKMKEAGSRRRYRQAMIAFENLESSYPSSDAVAQGRELAGEILPRYLRIISAKAASAKEKLATHERNLNNIPIRDAKRVREEFEKGQALHKASVEEARKSRTKWLPENDFDERGLQNIERNITSFITSLSRPARERTNLSQLYRDGWAAASNGDTTGTEKVISKLRSSRIDEKYLELLATQLEANPAPEAPPEDESTEVAPPEVEEPKEDKKKKKKSAREESDEAPLPAEEEESSMMPLVFGILGLAIIGILVGVVLKGRKSDED
ncbi:hypothetical protein N9Z02_00875 [Akkermansiaceae bacterium]|nr:hypothetical protein [Akkermansiaceae bacterium]